MEDHESATAAGSTVKDASVPASAPVVSVRGLSKHYRQLIAVDQLTFTLERGTITGFLGPNGAGKTTTSGTITPQPRVVPAALVVVVVDMAGDEEPRIRVTRERPLPPPLPSSSQP
jgi:ABC-type uncharacterized transport system ATPase subunit